MFRLKNIRVSKKIVLMTALILSFQLLIGAIGFGYISRQKKDIEDIYSNHLLAVQLMNDVRANAKSNEANLLYVIMNINKPEEQRLKIADIEKMAKAVDEAIKVYEKLKIDKFERDNLAIALKSVEEFRKIRTGVVELSQKGKAEEAYSLLYNNINIMEEYQKKFLELSEYSRKIAEQTYKDSEKGSVYAVRLISIAIIVSLLVSIIFTVAISLNITMPLKKAVGHLKLISTGDFSFNVPAEYLNRKDDMGDIANSIHHMQESIKSMIKTIIEEAKNIYKSSEVVNLNMNDLNGDISSIAALSQELSAGIEESSASVEEVNSTSTEIENTVNFMAEKAIEGANSAVEINEKAINSKAQAVLALKETQDVYKKTHENLEEAIEKSKAVEQIEVLSNAILSIAHQTNLLALNASIESARAGESGKGFAVVANEIRKLAEESKSTVEDIQKTTKVILEAVKGLASHSKNILEFMDRKVLNDYKVLIHICEQYGEDASYYSNLSLDLSATSQELLSSIENITEAIENIAVTADQEARDTNDISQNTILASEKSGTVLENITQIQRFSDNLSKAVCNFKIS